MIKHRKRKFTGEETQRINKQETKLKLLATRYMNIIKSEIPSVRKE